MINIINYDNKKSNNYILHIKALFMILLIVMLPICFSDAVFANSVSIQRIYGEEDEIGFTEIGYRKATDATVMDILVTIDGDTAIANSQLTIVAGTDNIEYRGANYVQCGATAGSQAECKFRTNKLPVNWQSQAYAVKLYSDAGLAIAGTDQATIFVDKTAPSISSFSYEIPQDASRSVIFKYKVQEYAGSAYNGYCSGVKSISLYNNSYSGAALAEVSENFETCTAEGNITYSFSQPGMYKACIKAIDNFGFESSGLICKDIDFMPPSFGVPKLETLSGQPIKYATSTGTYAVVSVEYTGSDFNTSSARANLESLNPSAKSIAGVCANGLCTFNVKVAMTQGSASSIQITAKDTAGNPVAQANYNLETPVVYDGSGPQVTSLNTNHGKDAGNKVRIGKETSITAQVTENAENLNPADMLLDLSKIGGRSGISANSCANNICIWNVTISGKDITGNISVMKESKDMLGNAMASEFSVIAVADVTPPKLAGAFNVTVLSQEANHPGYVLKGDSFDIYATVNETSDLTWTADLSSVISSPNPFISSGCNRQGQTEIWNCSWKTRPVDVSGGFNAKLKFNFTDIMGNIAPEEYSLNTTPLLEDENPNFWKAEGKAICSPSWVEKELSGIVNQRVYCRIPLTPAGSEDVETVSLMLDDCISTPDNPDSAKNIAPDPIILLNKGPGSRNPYFMLKVIQVPDTSKTSNISLLCPLYIITKTEGGVTKNPEIENVTVVIDVSDRVGDAAKQLESKVNKINKRANDQYKFIGTAKKWVKWGEQICNLLAAWRGANKIATTAGMAVVSLSNAPSLSFLKPIGNKIVDYSKQSDVYCNKVDSKLGPYCKFITCEYTAWRGFLQYYNSYIEWQKKILKTQYKEKTGAPSMVDSLNWPTNPKDSLILSIFTLCFPGMVLKAEEFRQIYCSYGVCLQQSGDSKISKDACLENYHYMSCRYIVGDIFQLFPFAEFARKLISWFKELLEDPVAILFLMIDYFYDCPEICPKGCTSDTWLWWQYHGCRIVQDARKVIEAYAQIQKYYDSWKDILDPKDDYCIQLEKMVKK